MLSKPKAAAPAPAAEPAPAPAAAAPVVAAAPAPAATPAPEEKMEEGTAAPAAGGAADTGLVVGEDYNRMVRLRLLHHWYNPLSAGAAAPGHGLRKDPGRSSSPRQLQQP